MPNVTAIYWKHDENQDEGQDVVMTIYEFLVDYVTHDLQIPKIGMHIYMNPTCNYILAR